MQFGLSTYLFHAERLRREHLAAIARRGFDRIELFALRSHFDYRDPRAWSDLRTWLQDTGVRLHAIHAPISAALVSGVWQQPFSIAAADPGRRVQAVQECRAALEGAREIETGFLVLHLGMPDVGGPADADNDRPSAVHSLHQIHETASAAGVRLALEVIPNVLSTTEALLALLEDETDLADAGICLDFGHAFLMGDLIDAIESTAGHLVTTHVHDNHRRRDDHLVPLDGQIDWSVALMAVQKIGYDGTLVLELDPAGNADAVLARAAAARDRMIRLTGDAGLSEPG